MSAYIIAEIGSNHDGDRRRAARLIEKAAHAGANAVKFQCLPNLPQDWMPWLMDEARACDLDCFATPFDVDAVQMLADLRVPFIKIASTEIVDRDLMDAAEDTSIPLIVSTGMATWDEVSVILRPNTTLLQCTVKYPTPLSDVNLRAMVAMRERFGVHVGLSDHTTSPMIPAAAVALGATMIEKHITLDSNANGPDHGFALEPWEFRRMVQYIRDVEQALGSPEKRPLDGEPLWGRGRKLRWAAIGRA